MIFEKNPKIKPHTHTHTWRSQGLWSWSNLMWSVLLVLSGFELKWSTLNFYSALMWICWCVAISNVKTQKCVWERGKQHPNLILISSHIQIYAHTYLGPFLKIHEQPLLPEQKVHSKGSQWAPPPGQAAGSPQIKEFDIWWSRNPLGRSHLTQLARILHTWECRFRMTTVKVEVAPLR